MSFTTENVYDGNGTTTLFSFTFPYIDEADVKVSLNSLDTTAFTLANATTVEFDVAPALGVTIRIYRSTPIDVASSTFFPGSAIRAQDLNSNFEQSLYVAQETQNIIENSDAASVIGIAVEARDTANQAEATANAVDGKATLALDTANSAETKSDQALADAATAQSTALNAKAIAENALDPSSVLADLSDVDGTTPVINQALLWTVDGWKPGYVSVVPGGGTVTDAWADVQSDGTVNASFNASVTRAALGAYDVLFTTPMPTAYYSVVGSTMNTSDGLAPLTFQSLLKTTQGFRATLKYMDDTATPAYFDNPFSFTVNATSA